MRHLILLIISKMLFFAMRLTFRVVFAAEGRESDSWETMLKKQRRANGKHWLIGWRPLLTHAKHCAKENYIFRHMLWKYIRFSTLSYLQLFAAVGCLIKKSKTKETQHDATLRTTASLKSLEKSEKSLAHIKKLSGHERKRRKRQSEWEMESEGVR